MVFHFFLKLPHQVEREPAAKEEEAVEIEKKEEAALEKEELVKKKVKRESKQDFKQKTNADVLVKDAGKSEPPKAKKKLERENTFTKEEPTITKEKDKDISFEAPGSQSDAEAVPQKYSSLDKKSGKRLDKIIKSRGKSTKKMEKLKSKETPNEPKSEKKNSTKTEREDAQKSKEDTKTESENAKTEKEKPLSSLTKKRSILKSLSGKHVGSEESADLASQDKGTKEVEAKPKPLSFKERSRQLFSKGSSREKDPLSEKSSEEKKTEKEEKRKSSEAESSDEEESEEEEESFDSEEDSEDDDEDGETEEGESEEEDDDSSGDDDDDEVTTTTEPTTTKGDISTTSESRALPKAISVLPDLHKVEASDSHDSEGVIVKKSPTVKKASVANKDNIVIVVSDFEAAKDAKFVEDEQVSQLYVEYKFLDLPVEELETPFSLPKPAPQEKITFNFRKVFAVDRAENSARRRLVSKMLRSEDDSSRLLTFLVVSEPPDPEEDCLDLGRASLDLGSILRTGQDIEDQVIMFVL